MRVGVPKESAPGERRVALVPESVGRLAAAGSEVTVEAGAGAAAGYPDESYREAGATVAEDAYDGVELVARVRKPAADELARLKEGTVLVGFLEPLSDPEGVERLAERGVVAFAMESIPRITRAQAMDALSSQATVAGYKAGLIAAERLPKFFPLLMTAAGTVAPAKVLVLGAGVAGLQAIATARRLGAVVSGFDVRPVVKEQVESLGATFLDLGDPRRGDRGRVRARAHRGGAARAAGGARGAAARLRRRDHDRARSGPPRSAADPGLRGRRDARRLGDRRPRRRGGRQLRADRAGRGGRPRGRDDRRPDRTWPSSMAHHASQLYSRNVTALLLHLAPEGELTLDFEDEITAGACVTRREEVAA